MLKLNRKFIYLFVVLGGIFILFYFINDFSLTGRAVDVCKKINYCENITIENCTEICSLVCENRSIQECIIKEIHNCSDTNESLCEENFSGLKVEECFNVTNEVCEEICKEINCTDVLIENCTEKLVCENSSDNETFFESEVIEEEGNANDSLEKEVENVLLDIDNIYFIESLDPLTLEEKRIIKIKTGESKISIVEAKKIGKKILIRFEIGDFWVEKVYDFSMGKDLLDERIEYDRLKFLKKIATLKSSKNNEERMEGYLIEYDI